MNKDVTDYLASMKRPLPGSSLTNNPKNRGAYEKAPEFTLVKEAMDYLFTTLTEEDNYVQLLTALSEGATIMDTARVLLFSGFTEGKWNPDLLLLLVEPLAYMLMAFAERAEINIIIDNDLDDDPDEFLAQSQNKLKEIQRKRKISEVPADVLPAEIQKKIEKMPVPQVASLMQRQG